MTLQWTLKHIPQTTESHSFKRWVSQHLWYDIFEYLPHARMRSRGKAMLSCLCVCPQKNIEKCFKQGRKGVYRHHSQRKTISIIILGRFCTWYKSRRFFMPLFQLLPIIGFVAPPLSKSHLVVAVAMQLVLRGSHAYPKIQAESIWQCTERRAW